MAKWRPLDEYTPFARVLVEYMWEQLLTLWKDICKSRLI